MSHNSKVSTPLTTTMPESKNVCMYGDSAAGVPQNGSRAEGQERERVDQVSYRLKFAFEAHAKATSGKHGDSTCSNCRP